MSGMGQPPPTSVTATFRTIHQGVLYGQPIPASHSAGLGRHATVWQQLAATIATAMSHGAFVAPRADFERNLT